MVSEPATVIPSPAPVTRFTASSVRSDVSTISPASEPWTAFALTRVSVEPSTIAMPWPALRSTRLASTCDFSAPKSRTPVAALSENVPSRIALPLEAVTAIPVRLPVETTRSNTLASEPSNTSIPRPALARTVTPERRLPSAASRTIPEPNSRIVPPTIFTP